MVLDLRDTRYPFGSTRVSTPQVSRNLIRSPIPRAPTPSAPPATSEAARLREAAQRVENKFMNVDEDRPWWQRGLGFALGNPVVKNALVPLKVLDVPRRAVAAGFEEAALALPEPAEWLTAALTGGLAAPMLAIDEDKAREADRGWGERLWSDETYGWGQLTGDTGNKWLDRAIGFVGDVGLDPLTYVAGIGAVNSAAKEAAMGGSRAGLAGRNFRMSRIADAMETAARRGVGQESDDLLRTFQRGAGRGLGTFTDDTARELLGIEAPALRLGLPFSRQAGFVVPGTERPARALAEGLGEVRQRINASRFGQGRGGERSMGLIGARTPIDYEKAVKTMALGEAADPADFLRAATTVQLNDLARPASQRMLNTSQREIQRARKQLEEEVERAGGSVEYLRQAEREGGTTLNALFDEIGIDAPREMFGVTIPRLSKGKGLQGYVPHAYDPEFLKFLDRDAAFKQLRQQRLGGQEQSLLNESRYLRGRDIVPGMRITVNGKTAEIIDGSIDDMMRVADELGYKGRVMETDPIKLLEDYAQATADDVGRRAARDQLATSAPGGPGGANPFVRFTKDIEDEQIRKTALDHNITEDQVREAILRSGRNVGDEEFVEVLRQDSKLPGMGRGLEDETITARRQRWQETELGRTAAQGRIADRATEYSGRVTPMTAEEAFVQSEELGQDIVRSMVNAGIDAADLDDEVIDAFATLFQQDYPQWSQTVVNAAQDGLRQIRADLAGDTFDPRRYFGMLYDELGIDLKPITSTQNLNILMDVKTQEMIENLATQIITNPNVVMQAFRKMTNYFKTWATLSPGFHVRNGLSAVFMNTADGVPVRLNSQAVDLWTQYERASREGIGAGRRWLAQQAPEVRKAFDATFGSGAGGRFAESGVAEGSAFATRAGRKLIENPATRWSQRTGARVEGPVRLAMAMDTINKGGTVQDALQRITRVHFDYSQVSRLDEQAKALIPFWSFVSRNLPLQVMQIWTRPMLYQMYGSFARNLADPTAFEGTYQDGRYIPQYIEDRGSIPLNLGPFNMLDPDLQHLRLTEDIERYSRVFDDPGQAFSDFNPWITAPVELVTRKDIYTGQQFDDNDLEKITWNPTEWPMVPLLAAAGQMEYGPGGMYADAAWVNALRATNPLLDRSLRMSGSGGAEPERILESAVRFLGLPARTVTDQQMRNEALNQYYSALQAAEKNWAVRE